jgi:hypothetical protein
MTGPAAKNCLLGLCAVSLLPLGMAGCLAVPAMSSAGSAQYRVVSQQDGDGITIDSTTPDVTIDITSERGIGSTEILRAGQPPKSLTIKLHLKGLEEMSLAWDATRVTAHVGSGNGDVREEVSVDGGRAASIDNASPYWMPIRIESADRLIPLRNGYFAVTAPPAFIEAAPQRFTLKWIDFYR